MRLDLDPALRSAERFPRIHEGRYEVDPEATRLLSPVPAAVRERVTAAGVRLLRVGLGCWLPTQDPDPSVLHEREWFLGGDLDDPASYCFTHLDRVLDVCLDLGVEILLSVDYMPAALARVGPPPEIPAAIAHAAPGYTFPDGIRCAPPADPALFAAAVLHVLAHVRDRGVTIRYVELWNEPDLPFFYSGTFEDYCATYEAFSVAVSGAGYPVGGPSTAFLFHTDDWVEGFCAFVSARGLPLDFYALHRYSDTRSVILDACHRVRAALDACGLTSTEVLLDEWGYDLRDGAHHATVAGAAFIASCLMQLPAAGVAAQTHVLLVDPVDVPSLGMVRRDGTPNPTWFVVQAFEELQSTPYRIPTPYDDIVLAMTDGTVARALVANSSDEPLCFELDTPGTARLLTQESYDASGGWGPPEPWAGSVVVPPHSLAQLELTTG